MWEFLLWYFLYSLTRLYQSLFDFFGSVYKRYVDYKQQLGTTISEVWWKRQFCPLQIQMQACSNITMFEVNKVLRNLEIKKKFHELKENLSRDAKNKDVKARWYIYSLYLRSSKLKNQTEVRINEIDMKRNARWWAILTHGCKYILVKENLKKIITSLTNIGWNNLEKIIKK